MTVIPAALKPTEWLEEAFNKQTIKQTKEETRQMQKVRFGLKFLQDTILVFGFHLLQSNSVVGNKLSCMGREWVGGRVGGGGGVGMEMGIGGWG